MGIRTPAAIFKANMEKNGRGALDLLLTNTKLTASTNLSVGILHSVVFSLQGFTAPCGCFREIACQALLDRMLQAVLHSKVLIQSFTVDTQPVFMRKDGKRCS